MVAHEFGEVGANPPMAGQLCHFPGMQVPLRALTQNLQPLQAMKHP
jgi:hypothetical protein